MLAQVNGLQVFYELDGNPDKPWLTMVTGITNDTTMWKGQIAALQNDFHILRYDLRGQGQSASTPSPYSIELLGADLIGLWDTLGITQSHLMGLGLGGSICLYLGIHQPSRIIKLVPCCCRAIMVEDFAVMWRQLLVTVEAGGIEAIVENTAQRWFSEDFKKSYPEQLEAVRLMIRRTSQAGYLGVVNAFLGLNLFDALDQIHLPTMLMGGQEDRIGGPPEIMQTIANQIPEGVYVPVPGAAHIANLQNPQGFNQILRQFLLK